MDSPLTRLYARMGRHYALALWADACLLALLIPPLFVYTVMVGYLGATTAEFAHVALTSIVTVEAGTVVAMILVLRGSRPVVSWIRGRRDAENAAAAWNSAARMPQLHITRATPPILVGGMGAVTSIDVAVHPSPFAIVVMAAGGAAVVALGVAIHMVSTGALMRPVLAEIDNKFPEATIGATERRSSLRPRIVISSLLVVMASSWLTGGLAAHLSNPSTALAVGIISGCGVGAIFGLVLATALGQSIFDPLRSLTAATRHVQQGDLTIRVPVVANDELGVLSHRFNEMVEGLAERQALHTALGTYIDPVVADRLLREGQVLEGEEVDVTIMFVDIVGFTARSETRQPAEIVEDLNVFFQLVLPVVHGHGGHTNKLLGDGFMAVFGAPVVMVDHADNALRAAFEIQERMRSRYGTGLRVGVGLNSGPVVVGTTGGSSKLDFTVIGDAVNVASRVEALTRTTGDGILLTETTKTALRMPVALAHRGSSPVRGRIEPVSVYAPVANVPA